ncbi:MAG: hypothetical protein OXN89_18875 [Bryobacterales bacterium]|nr:hypothetical protein [Bryobacterales bacterium]
MQIIIVTALLLISGLGADLQGQEFSKSKLYIEQNHKLKLVSVSLDIREDSLVAVTLGKNPQTVRIEYSDVTDMEYERSAHRRWKTGVLLSPLFLLSKGKKHWFAVLRGEDETVFQLSKTNYARILSAVESRSGLEVKMIARRG